MAGVTWDRGGFYYVKRVPKRFAHVDARSQVRICLHTDSRREAEMRAARLADELDAQWRALDAGEAGDARAHYDALRDLARAQGFTYRPAAEIVEVESLRDILDRLKGLAGEDWLAPEPVIDARIGAVEKPPLTMTEVLAEFFARTPDRTRGKSALQIKRWQQPRARAVRNFVEVVGDLELGEIQRSDALKFRDWWQARTDRNPETANKDFGHLADVFRTVVDLHGLNLASPFQGLRLKPAEKPENLPFSTDWIRTRLLPPEALAGLNTEARLAFLIMVNTGARPSEILGARPGDFMLAHDVPHLAIQPYDGRSLKTRQSKRELPLLGVSLTAAQELVAAGGVRRYRLKGDQWSAAVNKYLRANGLRETPGHTAYSLRHAFEDRLLEAGVDDRLRAELMGHKYGRPSYGRGGALALKMAAIARIAL